MKSRRINNLNTEEILKFIHDQKKDFDQIMKETLQKGTIPTSLHQSMQYSLLAGGKRLRPILLLASFLSLDQKIEKAYSSAIALEMIHTYSLIHDDLPAMDDDDYRRGNLTNHKKFDEATAILAGDALLTQSFDIIASDQLLTAEEKVFLTQYLAEASGPKGMVAGQILDMEAEEAKNISLEALEEIHQLKTGKLIEFAAKSGAYLAGATPDQLTHIVDFAKHLGLIFQVQDDILDIEGDQEKLGKPIGSDVGNDKSTYPALLGLAGAKKQKTEYISRAKDALFSANLKNDYLLGLLMYFSERDH